MNHQPSPKVSGPVINRLADVMTHCDRFCFRGSSRLAQDAGVDPASVSRLLRRRMNPSFLMVARLTEAVEQQLGFRIDPRDLFAEQGRFPTAYVCDLTRCRGCMPEVARDESGTLRPAFEGVRPGEWVSSEHPQGYGVGEEAHA